MSDPVADPRLEAELRAMLQRRALDIDPEPPPWRELAQRNGAIVISLRTGDRITPDPAAVRRHRLLGRQWLRPVIAATVALVVAIAGAVVVRGAGPGENDTADGPETIDVPGAGQSDFDAVAATPIFPLTDDSSADALPLQDWLTDAKQTAERYLGQEGGLEVGQPWIVVGDPVKQSFPGGADGVPVQTATVAWSAHAEHQVETPPLAQGVVFLRNAELGGRDTWFVVGVMTLTLQMTDIRRDGDELAFTIDRTAETETFAKEDARVSVDDVAVGQVPIGESRRFVVRHPGGVVAIVKVQNYDGGRPWSITSTAVAAIPGGSTRLEDDPVAPTGVDEPPTVPDRDGKVGVVVTPGTSRGGEVSESGEGAEVRVEVAPDERRVTVSPR